MAHSNRAASACSNSSPEPESQLINGDSTNPEDVEVTQDATQRGPTSHRDDASDQDDASDRGIFSHRDHASDLDGGSGIDPASKYNLATVKDESQNAQAKTHTFEPDHEKDGEDQAVYQNGHRDENGPAQEPLGIEQDQLSERAQKLRNLNWGDLQQAFQEEMDKKTEEEELLKQQFQQCTELYLDWASMPAIKEEERAAKRLRTRIAYVQHEEGELHAKEEHLERVRGAFQKALGMLTGS